MNKKVVKFGGTSMASAESIRKVRDIVLADKKRTIVVVSAPGKRFKGDVKVTDLLYKAYAQSREKCDLTALDEVKERFETLSEELSVKLSWDEIFDKIKTEINESKTPDYTASRGEYLSALLFSKVIGFKFVDAKDLIAFDGENYDGVKTGKKAKSILEKDEKIVVPGFYGEDENGNIRTFSRGGSDVTGAILAAFSDAELYENFTDVSGFMVADPSIVENAKTMEVLNYEELRELAYMGAGVLHPDSIFPLKNLGIPINIKNTFRPEDAGTMIVKNYEGDAKTIITGIAGHKHNTTIVVEKAMLNNEVGTVRKILSVLEENGISFEHLPTGIDTMSLVVSDANLQNTDIDEIVEAIKVRINPDKVSVIKNLTLIAVVGKGMTRAIGCAARIFTALSRVGVNIRMIDQGSSEMNIIIGVEDEDYKKAVRSIYGEFFG